MIFLGALLLAGGLAAASPDTPLPAERATAPPATGTAAEPESASAPTGPAATAAEHQNRGEWEEAAAAWLLALRTGVSPHERRVAASAAALALTTAGAGCSDDGIRLGLELERLRAEWWSRAPRQEVPGELIVWSDLLAAGCRQDEEARRRLRAADYLDGVALKAQILLALGDLAQASGDAGAAASHFQAGLEAAVASGGNAAGRLADALRLRLAGARLRGIEPETAVPLLDDLEARHAGEAPRRDVLLLRGRIDLAGGRVDAALEKMGMAAQRFAEGPVRWGLLLEQAKVALEADRRHEALALLEELLRPSGEAPVLIEARLLLADRLRGEGEAGARRARHLYRGLLAVGSIEEANRALDRLVESWISTSQPLRAFAELSVLIEGEDSRMVALARDRLAALLPRYLEIFAAREDAVSAVILYRLAERSWLLPGLQSPGFAQAGGSYAALSLPEHAIRTAALGSQTAAGAEQRQAAALVWGRLLLAAGRPAEAVKVLLAPDHAGCGTVRAAAGMAATSGLETIFASSMEGRDLAACDAAVVQQAAAVIKSGGGSTDADDAEAPASDDEAAAPVQPQP